MIEPFLFFIGPPLIGILAICLGIWYERGKEAEGIGRGWKYLMFSVIGILSFFAGFYLGDEMHLGYVIFKASGGPLAIFPFALIIYALLFFLGLYISRERSLGFGLKVFGISFLFFFLAFYGIMDGLWCPRALLCEAYSCREIWGTERIYQYSRGGIREVSIP